LADLDAAQAQWRSGNYTGSARLYARSPIAIPLILTLIFPQIDEFDFMFA